MYLAAQMPGRTAVLLTGQGLGAVGASIDLATALQPAMVVLEDVDLVAMDRSYEETNPILFELLNAMDGLDEDHDVLFVLTTNRADLLEPALAARPGRIDQAVELPLPDAEGRRRLLELYGEGLELTLTGDEPLIAALEGVSPRSSASCCGARRCWSPRSRRARSPSARATWSGRSRSSGTAPRT